MQIIRLVKTPLVIFSGVALGLVLLFKRTSQPAQVSTQPQVNTELELAKIQAETAARISDNELGGFIAQYQAGNQAMMYQTNAGVSIASMDADVAKYGLAVDLLKTIDTNSANKIVSLADINAGLTSNLNEQNNFLQLGLFDSQNNKEIAFKSFDTMQNIAYRESDNNLQATLDNNATNRFLVPLQLDTQRQIANLDYQNIQSQIMSNNYQALLQSTIGGGSGYSGSVGGSSNNVAKYAKMGILAVGAIAAPFTGGASLAGAGSVTGAMQGAGI